METYVSPLIVAVQGDEVIITGPDGLHGASAAAAAAESAVRLMAASREAVATRTRDQAQDDAA